MKVPKHILPVIVFSQFCCTSLWFAGNGVISDLVINFKLQASALGHLTSSVQFGFIIGTLFFAIFSIADRFSPSRVFFISSVFGALSNLFIIWEGHTLSSLLLFRFMTGFFLAGIYPVGMKIAADYYEQGLGKSLSLLVGALVLGTAFPHLLKEVTDQFQWKTVLIVTSALSFLGGLLILFFAPDGPYRKSIQRIDFTAFFKVFRNRNLRSAAFGYFGHMWELYAFWVFVPVILQTYKLSHPEVSFNVSIMSFFIISIGGLSCVLGGYLSQSLSNKLIASAALFLSGLCCLVSPWIFDIQSEVIFIGFLLFWGIVVTADSPLLSTMVAQNAKPEIKATALTIVNSIGFAITIISIQLLNILMEWFSLNSMYAVLAIGPIFGFIAIQKKL